MRATNQSAEIYMSGTSYKMPGKQKSDREMT